MRQVLVHSRTAVLAVLLRAASVAGAPETVPSTVSEGNSLVDPNSTEVLSNAPTLLRSNDASASSQNGGLTLNAILREALSTGFETRLANVSVDAARGDARAFSAIANPGASFTYGRALGYDASQCGGGGCSPNQYTIGLSDQAALNDVISGKHGLRKEIGRKSVTIAGLQRDDAIRVVRLAAKQQFASLVFSQARLRVAEFVLKSALETEQLVQARYNSGAPLPDLLRAEAVTLDARQRLRAAQTQLTSDKAALALLMGRPSLEGVGFDETLLTSSPPVRTPPNIAPQWIEQAKSHRPDRLAAEVAVEQSDSNLRLARRNRWPDIELALGYTQQGLGNSAIQPGTVSVSVSAPIPLLYQNQGQIDRAIADASARTLERQRLDLQIASAVKTSLAKVSSAWEQAQNAEERLKRARRAVEIVRIQYQEGATSLVDLLQATGAATDAEDNFLEARESFWNQLFQLEYDSGKELVK